MSINQGLPPLANGEPPLRGSAQTSDENRDQRKTIKNPYLSFLLSSIPELSYGFPNRLGVSIMSDIATTTRSDILEETMPDLVNAVRDYTDLVFDHCRPSDSPTQLLADGIDLDTGKPLEWSGQTTTNLACQQNFLRTLDALSEVTGDGSHRSRADAWIGEAIPKIQDPVSGLFYWGGHTSYDLIADEPILGNHEMKCVFPHYASLYRVGPDAVSRFIEADWHAHIWDWQTLLFNRHGEYQEWERKWDTAFEGGSVPIVENTALSFVNTGSDLILAGAMLHKLSGNETSLRWAYHLLSRYEDIRHPETGLAGYQFNHRDPCRVHASFKPPFDARTDINEVTVVTNNVIKVRYARAALTLMNAYEELGEDAGKPLIDLVSRDLTALAEHCYNADDHCFYPAINDGTRLFPENANDVGYCPPSKLTKVPADGLLFLSYARAYHLTHNERFREVAESLAAGMGWDNLVVPETYDGKVNPPDPHGWVNLGQNDVCALFGLLELHSASGESRILQSAQSLGRQFLDRYSVDGWIVSHGKTGETNIDTALPLALLHLAAAGDGSRSNLPMFYANNTYFDPKIVIRKRQK